MTRAEALLAYAYLCQVEGESIVRDDVDATGVVEPENQEQVQHLYDQADAAEEVARSLGATDATWRNVFRWLEDF